MQSETQILQAFNGTWNLEPKSDNMDDFLEAQGIGWAKRKLMNSQSPALSIFVNGDKVTIKQETMLSTSENCFTLGADFEPYEEKATGETAHRKMFLEGDRLVVISKNSFGDTTVSRYVNVDELTAECVFVAKDGSKTLKVMRYFSRAK